MRAFVGGTGLNVEPEPLCRGRDLWHERPKGAAMRMRWLALSVLAGLTAAPVQAEYPWWVIGQRDLNVEGDGRQVIGVGTVQRFLAVRLCVTRQPILIRQVDVRFREGGTRTYQLGSTLQNQRCTGDIVLSGGARELAEVTVSYNPAGLSRRGARLQLHAR